MDKNGMDMKTRRAFRLAAILAIVVCGGCKKESGQTQAGTPEKAVSKGPVGLSIAKLSHAKFYEGIRVMTDTLSLSDVLLPGKGPTVYTATYEQITGSALEFSESVNRILRLAVVGADESIISGAEALFERNKGSLDAEYFVPYSETVKSRLISLSDSFMVFEVAFESYEGGAHPIYGTSAKVLRAGDLKFECSMKDVFSGVELGLLTKSLRDSLRRRKDDLEVDVDTVSLPKDFFFDGKSVSFRFPPYSIGAGALGEVVVSFPWID